MSLSPPIKIQKLQTALHAKAKGSPDQRFPTWIAGWVNWRKRSAYRAVDEDTRHRLRQWLREAQSTGSGGVTLSRSLSVPDAGLGSVVCANVQAPVGESVSICLNESRVREIRTPGLMSGMWKRSHGPD